MNIGTSDPRRPSFFDAEAMIARLAERIGRLEHRHARLVARKAAATSRASTTALADDPDLLFGLGPGEAWLFEGALFVTGDQGGDINLTFAGPTGATGRWGIFGPGTSDTSTPATATTVRYDAALIGAELPRGTSSSSEPALLLPFWGLVVNGNNAGQLVLRWAQRASHATATTVLGHSFLSAQRI